MVLVYAYLIVPSNSETMNSSEAEQAAQATELFSVLSDLNKVTYASCMHSLFVLFQMAY